MKNINEVKSNLTYKDQIKISVLVILGFTIAMIGGAYAYFSATVTGEAVTNTVQAAILAGIDFEGGQNLVIPDSGIYPGWYGVQSVTINKPDGLTEGVGAYSLTMDPTVDPAYGDWVTYEVYKTTDAGKTITRVEGDVVVSPDGKVSQTDDLTFVGFTETTDAFKKGSINSTTTKFEVDKQNYDMATFETVTYIFVYHFTNPDIDQNAAMGKNFTIEIDVEMINQFENIYEDTTLAGNDPYLGAGLVPVAIAADGTVKVADPGTEWYNYDNSEWANAVLVNDTFTTLDPGTTIPMTEIYQMYVWIPRYSYDAASIETAAHAIDVTFVDTSTTAHSAFTFGTDELTGFWVAKFEYGHDGTIKPNQNSLNNTDIDVYVSEATNINNTKGLDSTSDVHIIKNTEWGAVAYLSQSKYGICNDDGTCSVEVSGNNFRNDSYEITTGCGAPNNGSGAVCPDENKWETANGVLASTTQNITGVYDMSGGHEEVVMSVMLQGDSLVDDVSTNFTTELDKKYYDVYPYSSQEYGGGWTLDVARSLPGDAIGELHPGTNSTFVGNAFVLANWNDALVSLPSGSATWLVRGKSGMSIGIFDAYGVIAVGISTRTTRTTIAPVN